jgi:acetyl esterase
MPLHETARAFLDRMASLPQPNDISIADFRRAAAGLIATGPEIQIGKVENLDIAGGDGQKMGLRVYVPEGRGPFPVLVWTHGGSFVRGTLDMFDAGRRTFTKASQCIVVAVDQRLSPEAQYPAPLNDAYAALVWASRNASRFGGDPELLGVAGESSGANIAAALTLKVRRSQSPRLMFQVLLMPLVDAHCDSNSMREFADGYVLTRRQLIWAYQQYAPSADPDDPLISPVRAKSLAGLPPAVIVTVEFDPVRDEGEAYAGRLDAAGVKVLRARIPGMVHHFAGPDLIPTATTLLRELLSTIRR